MTVLICVVALGGYSYFFEEEIKPVPVVLVCGGQGEIVDLTDSSTANECCVGLENVNIQDSVSVAGRCYSSGTESGAPILICSDCGNGVCEDVESVCGCSEDCASVGVSDFESVQAFCEEGYERYCDRLPEGMELDLCGLCD